MLKKTIYLDNAATTPMDIEVLDEMNILMKEVYGNPSSIHQEGRKARTIIEKARKTIAQSLNVSIGEIYFTGGGTESNNTALLGSVRDLGITRIISSPTEHPATLEMLSYLAQNYNTKIHFLDVDLIGYPDLVELKETLSNSNEPSLVSLMHSNNELGTLIDLDQVSKICIEHNALFHTDTVQTMGYYPLDFNSTKVSFASASAHKLYGPKGVGFLYMSNDNIVRPFILGGGQERGLRSGTENIYGIAGLAKSMALMEEHREARTTQLQALRSRLLEGLKEHLGEVEVFIPEIDKTHLKVIHLILPKLPKAELIVMNMDIEGICISGGSACSSGAEKTSHVIDAVSPDDDRKHIRVSISHHNTLDEIDQFIHTLYKHLYD